MTLLFNNLHVIIDQNYQDIFLSEQYLRMNDITSIITISLKIIMSSFTTTTLIIMMMMMPNVIDSTYIYVTANIVAWTLLSIFQDTTAADSECKDFRDSYAETEATREFQSMGHVQKIDSIMTLQHNT